MEIKRKNIHKKPQHVEIGSGWGKKIGNKGIDDAGLQYLISIGCRRSATSLWLDVKPYMMRTLQSLGCNEREYTGEAWMCFNDYVLKWKPEKGSLCTFLAYNLRQRIQECRRKEALVVVPQKLARGADKVVTEIVYMDNEKRAKFDEVVFGDISNTVVSMSKLRKMTNWFDEMNSTVDIDDFNENSDINIYGKYMSIDDLDEYEEDNEEPKRVLDT